MLNAGLNGIVENVVGNAYKTMSYGFWWRSIHSNSNATGLELHNISTNPIIKTFLRSTAFLYIVSGIENFGF